MANSDIKTVKPTADAVRRDVEDAAESVGDYARNKADELKSEGSRLLQEGKEKATRLASDAYESAKSEADSRVHEARGSAADEVDDFASGLRKAASTTRDGSIQAQAFGQLADIVADFSDNIRDKDLSQIASDVAGYARQRPLLFLGAAALAGFAITRFAKASAGPAHRSDGSHADHSGATMSRGHV